MLEELRRTDKELDTVLRFIGFTESDLARLKKVNPLIKPKLAPLNDAFYELLEQDPTMASYLTEKVDTVALKAKLLTWLESLFTGVVDEEFIKYQAQIGYQHGKYRVAPVAVAPTMTLLRLQIPKLLTDEELESLGENREDVTTAITRLLDLTHFLMDRDYHNRLLDVTGMSKSLVERLMAG